MTRLLVVGDVLLDRDVEGTVERVCPDAPAPVVDVRQVHERPGGAGLAALLAVAAGCEVELVTALADDPAGRRLRALLEPHVRVHALVPAGPTVGKTRVRAAGQVLLRLDDAGHLLGGAADGAADGAVSGTAAEPPTEVLDVAAAGTLEQLLRTCDAVLVADYGGAVARSSLVRGVLTRHAGRVPVVWDPHPRGDRPVHGTTVVTPNRAEARGLLGDDAPPEASAPRLRERWGVEAVALTDGADGVVLADGREVARVRGPVCPPSTDTCGAGDRFAAALAAALADGADAMTATRAAVQAVSGWLAAGGVGALGATAGDGAPLAGGASADDVVAAVRARGGTVVAAGGCFDVLHAGHLELLRAARSQGSCLVVLLNSDDGVRRLKGEGRPVNPAADRARLLEALEVVDAVEVFEDDTPVATIERLQPDVWVKGGDYRPDDLPETPAVTAYGGRVHVVPLLDGRSTTALLARGAPGRAVPR